MNQNASHPQTDLPAHATADQPGTKAWGTPGAGPNSQEGKEGKEGKESSQDGEGYSQGMQATDGQGEVSASGGAMAQYAATALLPPVDIVENEAGVTIYADMPGVSKDRLGVRVEGDNLTIEGTAAAPDAGEMQMVYGDMLNPSYRRSFTLSRDLDPGKIEASLDNGVLCLRIPKSEDAKPRRIEVKVN